MKSKINIKDTDKYRFDAEKEMVKSWSEEYVKSLDKEVVKALNELIKDADEENEPDSFTKRLKKKIREDDRKEIGEPLIKIVKKAK